MTDDLYERYKESLRVGHVAVLRGSLTAAVDAYRTAAEIAPSRALPHTSLGGVYLRLGQVDDALVEYAAAVARAPRDEGALLGQADALGTAGRREDAATALDQVADLQSTSGRLPEAADTLRRAIELHRTPARIDRQQELVRQVRLSEGDQVAERLLARALRFRDEIIAVPDQAADVPSEPVAAAAADTAAADTVAADTVAADTAADEPEPPAEPEYAGWQGWWGEVSLPERELPGRQTSAEDERPAEPVEATRDEAAAETLAVAGPAAVAAQESAAAEERIAQPEIEEPVAAPIEVAAIAEPAAPDVVGVMTEPEADEDVVSAPTGDELLAAAEAAESAGDTERLRTFLLEAARVYGRETRYEAGIEAAHRVLGTAPSDLETHLVLVELYMARDWNTLAAEKLELLARLTELSGDEEGQRRVCALATANFPRDERFGAVCG